LEKRKTMGSATMIHVETKQVGDVIRILEEQLGHWHSKAEIRRGTGTPFSHLEDDVFINSEEDPPTMFTVDDNQPGWVSIHCNSWFRCNELQARLSLDLDCLVIQTLAQTTSEAYLISIHREGKHLRTLEFGDSSLITQMGTPFDFEQELLGKDSKTLSDGTVMYFFDMDGVADYCRNFGLSPWFTWNTETLRDCTTLTAV